MASDRKGTGERATSPLAEKVDNLVARQRNAEAEELELAEANKRRVAELRAVQEELIGRVRQILADLAGLLSEHGVPYDLENHWILTTSVGHNVLRGPHDAQTLVPFNHGLALRADGQLCRWNDNRDGPGRVHEIADRHLISLGELDGMRSDEWAAIESEWLERAAGWAAASLLRHDRRAR